MPVSQFGVQTCDLIFRVLEPDVRHLGLLSDRLDDVVFVQREHHLTV